MGFENFIRAIDVDYDSEHVIFTGWLYKLNTRQFNMVNIFQYGRGTDFKQDFFEYKGNNCYPFTSGDLFIKCINNIFGKDYTEDFLTLIPTEQRRSNVMTSARIQPFCKKHIIIIIGFFDGGLRVCPRDITERNIVLYMYKNRFRLVGKSNGISFIDAIEELKLHCKIAENVISDKHV